MNVIYALLRKLLVQPSSAKHNTGGACNKISFNLLLKNNHKHQIKQYPKPDKPISKTIRADDTYHLFEKVRDLLHTSLLFGDLISIWNLSVYVDYISEIDFVFGYQFHE